MPVFTVGSGAVEQLSALMNLPLYHTNHQAGHIAAALYSGIPQGAHLALHLSGSTTEVLRCELDGTLELLGGSDDLHAGQFFRPRRRAARAGLSCRPCAGKSWRRSGSAIADRCHLPRVELFLFRCGSAGYAYGGQRGIYPPEQLAAEVYSCLARTIESC